MAGISTLKVTPGQLKSKAGEFKSKAADVKSTTQEMLQLMKGINEMTWSGDAAGKFKQQFAKLEKDMTKMYQMIIEYSNDLQDIAKEYETTEKANETIAGALATDIL